jgi:FkbM family methyltransferase
MSLGSRLKRFLRSALHCFGLDIVRHVENCEKPFDLLPFIVRDYLRKKGQICFVQIGANDGLRYDPLRELIKEHRLYGLLVEPLPDQFEKLRQNYSDQPQLCFENCAVDTADGFRQLYRVRMDAQVPDWAHGLASFDRTHLGSGKQNLPGLEKHLEAITVPTMTMGSLLTKHQMADVSLLQIDTEGFDYQIIRLTFAASCYPAIINYENLNLSLLDRLACHRLLASKQYQFIDVGPDTIAVRPDCYR